MNEPAAGEGPVRLSPRSERGPCPRTSLAQGGGVPWHKVKSRNGLWRQIPCAKGLAQGGRGTGSEAKTAPSQGPSAGVGDRRKSPCASRSPIALRSRTASSTSAAVVRQFTKQKRSATRSRSRVEER